MKKTLIILASLFLTNCYLHTGRGTSSYYYQDQQFGYFNQCSHSEYSSENLEREAMRMAHWRHSCRFVRVLNTYKSCNYQSDFTVKLDVCGNIREYNVRGCSSHHCLFEEIN